MSAKSGTGTLYLLPTGLGSGAVGHLLAGSVLSLAGRLTHFVAENPKSARAFLKHAGYPRPLTEASIATLDKNTPEAAIPGLLGPLQSGMDVGLLSEAGCPAVADPGALLVLAAHRAGIAVVPLVGPSSILLALMASGLNGQRFSFHGYLPVADAGRAKALQALERHSLREGATQIFIETPYRNEAMLRALLDHCADKTWLCIATDLTLPTEHVATRRIAEWRRKPPALDRRPSVFLLLADAAAPRIT